MADLDYKHIIEDSYKHDKIGRALLGILSFLMVVYIILLVIYTLGA